MLIKASNTLDVLAEYTYIANNVSAGTNTFSVKNTNPFTASWAVQFGKTGESQSEIKILSSSTPSGTLGTISTNFSFDHPADTPIYAIKYDQIVFERSTSGTTGNATPITNGTVSITPNTPFTQFDDTSGAATYAYKVYYLNSTTSGSSSESDWLTSSGFAFHSLAKMRQRVKSKLVNSSYIVDDTEIDDWINEWLETMTNAGIDVDEGYLMGTTSVAYPGTTELGTISATDFKQPRRVWYVDSSGTYQATKMESNTYAPTRTFSTTSPYFYWEGDTVLGRKPSDQGPGTYVIEYYKLSAVLVNDTDTLPASMQGYTKSFVNYAVGNALYKDSQQDTGDDFVASAMADRELFKKEITPRNKTGVTYIDIVEDTSDQGIWL